VDIASHLLTPTTAQQHSVNTEVNTLRNVNLNDLERKDEQFVIALTDGVDSIFAFVSHNLLFPSSFQWQAQGHSFCGDCWHIYLNLFQEGIPGSNRPGSSSRWQPFHHGAPTISSEYSGDLLHHRNVVDKLWA
jgi:hypothetical protein